MLAFKWFHLVELAGGSLLEGRFIKLIRAAESLLRVFLQGRPKSATTSRSAAGGSGARLFKRLCKVFGKLLHVDCHCVLQIKGLRAHASPRTDLLLFLRC